VRKPKKPYGQVYVKEEQDPWSTALVEVPDANEQELANVARETF
jgi:hypothetical protein